MKGDERVRFCAACQKNVYNVAELSEAEVRELIKTHEGNLCVRIYRRKDGTVLTSDCPVGRRRLFDQRLRQFAWVSTVIGLVWEVFRLFPEPEPFDLTTGVMATEPSVEGRPNGEGGSSVESGVSPKGAAGEVDAKPIS